MDTAAVLSELGLSDGEVKVYLALLKLGSAPVNKLKEETKMHRTTIYDFIEKLINKGLVSYVIKAGVNYYTATSPDRLMDFLKEKEGHLSQIMPQLKKLSEFHKEDLKVEIFRGLEGYKTLFNTIVNTGKDLYGIGFDETKYEEHLPIAIRQYFRKLKEKNIKEFIIEKEGINFFYDKNIAKTTTYKFMPEEYFGPNPLMVFGEFVAIHNWNPMSVILMKNRDLAKSYKAHFDLLWNNPVRIYRGNKYITKVFDDIVDASIKSGAYFCFGASATSNYLIDYFKSLCKRQVDAGVKARIIFDEEATEQMDICVEYKQEVRTFPKQYITPTEVNIAGDKTVIVFWTEKKEPIAFIIEGKEVADSFKKYFELMWSIAKPYKNKKHLNTPMKIH
ncbi:helix-turn-helix domain-containing protein [Candidatus Woesearchaeota archaeon]|nr:helix-turn-helix domain-containing protein [Candidatus Woesearchaeota archaeon]